MPRTITIPAREVREEIRMLEEYPPTVLGGPGSVRIVIGVVDDEGKWVESIPSRTVQIDGSKYDELVGLTAPEWAPGKPPGTYRNEDLWPLVDALSEG